MNKTNLNLLIKDGSSEEILHYLDSVYVEEFKNDLKNLLKSKTKEKTLYERAIQADNHFQDLLEEEYGKEGRDKRYIGNLEYPIKIQEAANNKKEADLAFLAGIKEESDLAH